MSSRDASHEPLTSDDVFTDVWMSFDSVSGVTDQKSSATSSVLLALPHRWKDQ